MLIQFWIHCCLYGRHLCMPWASKPESNYGTPSTMLHGWDTVLFLVQCFSFFKHGAACFCQWVYFLSHPWIVCGFLPVNIYTETFISSGSFSSCFVNIHPLQLIWLLHVSDEWYIISGQRTVILVWKQYWINSHSTLTQSVFLLLNSQNAQFASLQVRQWIMGPFSPLKVLWVTLDPIVKNNTIPFQKITQMCNCLVNHRMYIPCYPYQSFLFVFSVLCMDL